ncbi:hypothetical protein M3677_16860, partial [Curtobacterium sp. P97]|nr:hypothetical protein [Curtobacterium sp. P97]
VRFELVPVFLRWDRQWALEERPAGATAGTTTDPVHLELMRQTVAAGDRSSDWWRQVGALAARDGQVAGCAAAVLDPARRAGGRRVLDPDGWSPPWSTVAALLEAVPRCVVKVAPGLDHDRVPEGVEAEWVSVGGSVVEALLWGRGVSATWRRATVVRAGVVHELTADTDPGRAPVAAPRGWLH